jgi:hypothetical protein
LIYQRLDDGGGSRFLASDVKELDKEIKVKRFDGATDMFTTKRFWKRRGREPIIYQKYVNTYSTRAIVFGEMPVCPAIDDKADGQIGS